MRPSSRIFFRCHPKQGRLVLDSLSRCQVRARHQLNDSALVGWRHRSVACPKILCHTSSLCRKERKTVKIFFLQPRNHDTLLWNKATQRSLQGKRELLHITTRLGNQESIKCRENLGSLLVARRRSRKNCGHSWYKHLMCVRAADYPNSDTTTT